MSDCITCVNFIRKKGNEHQKCMMNNIIKLSTIDELCTSLFTTCSDYVIDNEYWIKQPDNSGDAFIVTYHGLFDKMEIARVHSEEIAQKMCSDHNITVPRHWFGCGLGHMSYIKKNNIAKEIWL